MADREKMIHIIKRCVNHEQNACEDCPYDNCIDMMLKDIVALLEASEPVEPILALDDGKHKLWQCGNCKVAVFQRGESYCHNCGRKVKWNG